MEKIVFNLYLTNETSEPVFDSPETTCFKNLEDFKRFVNNPCDLWNREDVEKFQSFCIAMNESYYYVDEEGNEIDEDKLDSDELIDFSMKARSKEEMDVIFDHVMKEYDDYLENIKNGNYSFNILSLSNTSSWNIEDVKECIRLTKDKVKQIDLGRYTLDQITDIVNSIDISDDVELKTRFNYNDTCKCSELKELIKYLNNIKNYIDRFDLSPLEVCIFIYDLIRERQFNENEDELRFHQGMSEEEIEEALKQSSDSRSLFKVFKSDKIVCAGFSNLYSAILELDGIKSDNAIYLPTDDSNTGHMSNIVYLNDDYYDVHGIFEVDTTWGRKRNKDGSYDYNGSIHNYFDFMRPLYEAHKIKKYHNLDYNTPSIIINPITASLKRIDSMLKLGAPSSIMQSCTASLIGRCESLNADINDEMLSGLINKLKTFMVKYGKNETVSIEEYSKVLNTIRSKIYYSNINPFAFRKALYSVKMIEHSIDKDKYPFEMKEFNKAFDSRMDNNETRLISALLGERTKLRMNKDRKLDLARMELLSVLHKAAQDNVNKNPVHHI